MCESDQEASSGIQCQYIAAGFQTHLPVVWNDGRNGISVTME